MARIVVLITPEKKVEIAEAIAWARAHVVPWDKMRDAVADPTPMLALKDRNPDAPQRPPSPRIVFEPSGVEACISFEEQPAGICRHLSISTRDGRTVLDPTMTMLVAAEFGIELQPEMNGRAWLEEYEPGRYAINIVILEVEREGGNA